VEWVFGKLDKGRVPSLTPHPRRSLGLPLTLDVKGLPGRSGGEGTPHDRLTPEMVNPLYMGETFLETFTFGGSPLKARNMDEGTCPAHPGAGG
jgi:hypothetical protein